MRTAFILLIGIHGLIHLMGFLKAFGIVEFQAINTSISKPVGLCWLLAFLLFTVTTSLVFIRSDYWWAAGGLAVVVSQVLIFTLWSDTKYGTIMNGFLLLVLIIGYAGFSFQQQLKEERKQLFAKSGGVNPKLGRVTPARLIGLPPVVQQWLTQSGMVGQPIISNVYLTQELQLKMQPEQAEWSNGTATQYFTVQPPAFNWDITTQMNSVLTVTGRDRFEAGKGAMQIKLLSLIPVANAQDNEKVDQATLQRYLAEIVWFPSAALSPYIQWETLGPRSARATMEYQGTKGSGVFYFDEQGHFQQFVALRYQDAQAEKPIEWTVKALKTEVWNGVKIPVECTASWKLAEGQWTWLQLKIRSIQYNVSEMPVR